MTKLLKEPLFHFMLLGGAIFVLFEFVFDDEISRLDEVEEIIVTEGRIESLTVQFAKMWQRRPSEEELGGLIREYIREEIMYREALAMGLDRDDTIVRRRMRQKIEFLSENIARLDEPSDEELQAFLTAHPEMFRRESKFTFRQVYINANDRGQTAEADALVVLASLQEDDSDAAALSDPLMIEDSFENQSERDVARTLGSRFLETLLETPTGSWQGPIVSGFGLHLVYVSERVDSEAPALAEVKEAVLREWSAVKRKQTNEEFYDMLRERYSVKVMMPETTNPSTMTAASE